MTFNKDWYLGVVTVIPIIFVALGLQGQYVQEAAKKMYEGLAGSKRTRGRFRRWIAAGFRVGVLLSVLFAGVVFALAAYALHVQRANTAVDLVTLIGVVYLFGLLLMFTFLQVEKSVRRDRSE
jgi:hypothetical protein